MNRLSRFLFNNVYLREIIVHLRLWWRLLRDPRVPEVLKLIVPVMAVVYLLWPVDIMPDLIPLLGQVDDAAVLLLALKLFESLAPVHIVQEHLDKMRRGYVAHKTASDDSDVIDIEYKVL